MRIIIADATEVSDSAALLMALVMAFIPAAVLFIQVILARRADADCLSVLNAWAWENGMTILRCRRRWWLPFSRSPFGPPRVVYRRIVVDRKGRLRTGWASVVGTI